MQAEDASVLATAQQQIIDLLRQRHRISQGRDDDFNVRTQQEIADAVTGTQKVMRLLLFAIAFVSLIVGGIGIMNIMLVSVTERTREIGLRKALGARRWHILIQFLLEALVLTFMGGIVGMAVAILLTWIIPPMPLYGEFHKSLNHEGDIFLRASTSVMIISFSILSVVGIVSGFFPALKASRMDPVEALRYE